MSFFDTILPKLPFCGFFCLLFYRTLRDISSNIFKSSDYDGRGKNVFETKPDVYSTQSRTDYDFSSNKLVAFQSRSDYDGKGNKVLKTKPDVFSIHSRTDYDSKGTNVFKTKPDVYSTQSRTDYDFSSNKLVAFQSRSDYDGKGNKVLITKPDVFSIQSRTDYDSRGTNIFQTKPDVYPIQSRTDYDSKGTNIFKTKPAVFPIESRTDYDSKGTNILKTKPDVYSIQSRSDYDSKGENVLKTKPVLQFRRFYDGKGKKVLTTKYWGSSFNLPDYFPTEKIKIANEFNFSLESLRKNHDIVINKYLDDLKLNENNIHLVYKVLLEIEDLTCMAEYVPLVQKDVILNPTSDDGKYWIRLKDCANIENVVAPSVDELVVVSKESSLISKTCPLRFKTDILLPHKDETWWAGNLWRRTASVLEIKKGCLYFRFTRGKNLSEDQIDSLPTTKYDIIIRSQRYPLRYQYKAMQLLGTNEKLRKYLFPTQKLMNNFVCLRNLDLALFNETIAENPEQLTAVQNVIEAPNVNTPFIIFGPPGTGKTSVVVESILQLFFRSSANRILVTSGSNSACDTIALRISNSLETHFSDSEKEPVFRVYSKSHIEKGKKSIDPSRFINSSCDLKQIGEHPIVVATLCTVGKLVARNLVDNFFTHIFVDEAGASTIPETLVAVMNVKSNSNCHLILSGDHKQLGAVIKSECAAQLALGKSLMEHLLTFVCYALGDNFNYNHTIQARLRRNYRSHPEILRLFNHLFYEDELIAAAKEDHVNLAAKWCKLPNPKFPIIFQAVHGATEKDNVSSSSFNTSEIEVVMKFLRHLLEDGINGQKVNQNDIGIVTPYKLQNQRIQIRLRNNGWLDVESGSVENFQGREKQVIIVSFVKSNCGLGFVPEPQRLNVLLSRPKSLLILIGNPLTLRRNSNLAFILDECERHGNFLRRVRTGKSRTKPVKVRFAKQQTCKDN